MIERLRACCLASHPHPVMLLIIVSVSQDGQFSLWMLIEIRDWSLHVWPGSEESWLIVMLGAGGGHTLGQG